MFDPAFVESKGFAKLAYDRSRELPVSLVVLLHLLIGMGALNARWARMEE